MAAAAWRRRRIAKPSCPGIEQICRSSAQRRGEGHRFAISTYAIILDRIGWRAEVSDFDRVLKKAWDFFQSSLRSGDAGGTGLAFWLALRRRTNFWRN
jgi:hypothetical protein